MDTLRDGPVPDDTDFLTLLAAAGDLDAFLGELVGHAARQTPSAPPSGAT